MGAVVGWLGEISFGTAAQMGLLLGKSIREPWAWAIAQKAQFGVSLTLPLCTGWKEPVLSLYSAHPVTSSFFSSASCPCSFSSRHLCPVLDFCHRRSSFRLLATFFSSSPPPPPLLMLCYSLHTLQLNRLASGGCDLRRNVISSPAIGCAPLKSVVTVSYYIVYLPEGGGSRTLTIFKSARSGATTSLCIASLSWYVMRFIMSTVILVRIGLRMRTRWTQLSWMLRCLWQGINRGLALKYHKSKSLPSTSISGWNDVHFSFYKFCLEWSWSHE